jgi:hypothetical protein
VNYTLARAVGYDQAGGTFRYYPRDPQRPFDPNEFGPALNDERHHLTLAATGHLPWGLEVSPILQAGSARSYLAISGNNMLNLGGGSSGGALIVTNAAPSDLLSATKLPLISGRLDVAEAACYYSGNCHIVPYNSRRGDPYFNVDMRLAKSIKLGSESRNLKLIFQAFNLFNHANYGNNFDGTVATLDSSKASATPNSGFGNPLGFINPAGSGTLPRAFIAEFGIRFSF